MAMTINWLAIIAATIASFVFGAVWYTALSKPWMAAAGFTDADMKDANGKPKMPLVPMAISLIAEFIMALVLAGVIAHVVKTGASWKSGLTIGALCWAGFVITTLLTNHAYGKAKAALTVIDGGHWLGVLLLQGAILGAML